MTKSELIDAYEEWLDGLKWLWFATLTFRGSPSPRKANDLFHVWISEIRKREGTDAFSWVRVAERGSSREHLHFHVLVAGLRDPCKWDWVLRWEKLAGDSMIFYYQRGRGGIRYMLKEAEPGRDFDIQIAIDGRSTLDS